MSLNDLFAGQMDIDAMMSRLRKIATDLELPFGDRSHTYNSRKAQEMGKWAEEAGQGEAFHRAVYHTYFVDGKNIADENILAGIAESIDLDPEKALQVVADGRYAAAVNADWQRADDLGVTAVPTMVFDNRQLVGFQPYASCREFIVGPV